MVPTCAAKSCLTHFFVSVDTCTHHLQLITTSSCQQSTVVEAYDQLVISGIVNWLLSMFCIDKEPVFVQFRLTFRQEFVQRQPIHFKKLIVKALHQVAKLSRLHMSVPVLLVKTECNEMMGKQINMLSRL